MFVAEDHKAYLRQPYYTPNSPFRLSGTEAKHKQSGEALLDDAQLSMVQLSAAVTPASSEEPGNH